jgi:hypothetical protein
MTKKSFFRRPSVGEIKDGKEPVLLESRIIPNLDKLTENQYAVIKEGVFKFSSHEDEKKFLKHGTSIPIPKCSQRDLMRIKKKPQQRFRETVEEKIGYLKYVSGFSFYPVMGNDMLMRKVLLVELLEAARIMAYGKVRPSADVTSEYDYIDANIVGREGGTFIVSTPSRRKKQPRYRFKVSSVPIENNVFAYVNPYGFSTQKLGVESKAMREGFGAGFNENGLKEVRDYRWDTN